MAYRGFTARLPIGAQGFTGTQNPSKAGPGHLVFVDGAELDGGIIRKEGGASKLNTSAVGGKVISGINWSPTPGTFYDVVFLDSGNVKRDTGAGTFSTTYVGSLVDSRDPPPWFLVCGGEAQGASRKLLLFSATNQVHVVSGTGATMAPIANPAADWSTGFPTFGVQHSTRVFAGGNVSDPHRLYYSTTSDHGNFTGTGSGSIAIYPGEGEILAGALSFRGAIIVFKYPKGIYVVNTVDPAPLNWTVIPLTRAVGTLNQHCIVQVENDVLYMDRFGDLHSLSATNEFGDINTSNLGYVNDIPVFMRTNMNMSRMRRCQGLWYPGKRQAMFAMPRIGVDDNNFRLVVEFGSVDQNGAPIPRFFMSRRDQPISLWMRPIGTTGVEKPAHGDASGFIWNMDQDTRNKGGVAYPIRLESANTDLSFMDETLATKEKTGQFLELKFEPRGDWTLDVEVYWDDILTDIVQFNMGTPSGAALDSFILDSDILGATGTKSVRERIVGSGRTIKLICENGGLNQDISLSEFHLSFTVGDERTNQ